MSADKGVLAGMTRKEAEALVARMDPVDYSAIEADPNNGFSGTDAVTVLCEPQSDIKALLALAALGAEVVGAKMGEATCVSAEGYEDSGVVDVRTAVVGPVALGATVLVLEGE